MLKIEWKPGRSLLLILMAAVVICFFVLAVGCKGPAPAEVVPEETAVESQEEAATQEEMPAEEAPAEEETETEAAEEIAEEEEIPEEEVPSGITALIAEADGYYDDGEYSKARKIYRDAFIEVDESGLSDEKIAELQDSFDANYKDALATIDAAMMHFGNAMTLDYEKRHEEAKAELEAALAVYPKYQEAIDALANMEALEGLN